MKTIISYLFLIVYFVGLNVSHAQTSDSLSKPLNFNQIKINEIKSPTRAMLRSIVLPGWGQFYNEAYWKIPVFWAGLGAFAYAWKWNNDKVKYYQNLYGSEHNLGYYKLREFYRSQRDMNAIFFALVYLMNILDAYVDAHFFEFNVLTYKENISVFYDKNSGLILNFRF